MIGSQPDKQGNYMSCKHDLANHTIDRGQIFLSAKEIFLDRLRAQWLGTDAMLLALVNHVVDKIEESQEPVSVQARSSIGHAGSRSADHWTPDACVYEPELRTRLPRQRRLQKIP